MIKKAVNGLTILKILKILSVLSIIYFVYAIFINLQYSLWRDEAFTALLVQKPAGEILKIMAQDNNPPLHPILLHFLSLIFGNSEVVLRLVSLFSIGIAGYLLRKLIKHPYRKEIITILFFTSFQSVYYATEARPYAIFMALTVGSFLVTKNLAKDISKKNIIYFILVHTLLLYSQTLAILVFFANFLNLLYIAKKTNLLNKVSFLKLITICAAPFILFIPWILVILSQLDNLQKNGFWLTFDDPLKAFYENTASFFSSGVSDLKYIDVLTALAFSIFVISFLVGIGYSIKKKKYIYLISFFVPFILVYLISFKQPLFYIRYIIFLLPFVLLLSTRGLWRFSRNLLITAVTLIFLLNLNIYRNSYAEDHKSVFHVLQKEFKEKNLSDYKLINDNEYSFFQCNYYFKDCLLLKKYDDINKSIGLTLIPKEVVIDESSLEEYSKIGILSWSSDYPGFSGLEKYKLNNEVHTKEKSNNINAYFYEKL